MVYESIRKIGTSAIERAPLSTQAYPGRSYLSNNNKEIKRRVHTHQGFIWGGGGDPGKSLTTKAVYPPPPKHQHSSSSENVSLRKHFFSLIIYINEHGAHKVVRNSAPLHPPPPPLHNPNKTESGCVDFPFRTDY